MSQQTIPTDEHILLALHALDLENKGLSSSDFEKNITSVSRATIIRTLGALVVSGTIKKEGAGKNTVYKALNKPLSFSNKAKEIRNQINDLSKKNHAINYNEDFYKQYTPGSNEMLGNDLSAKLLETSRKHQKGKEPAGTLIRRILEPLLVGMSWSSSRLEGNRYSVADTRALFKHIEKHGTNDTLSESAQMLINHKQAIELMVDAAPYYGLSYSLATQIHKNLMHNLMADENAPGSIRRTMVFIEGTNYTPEQSPHALEQHLRAILDKASKINNPVESAFFLWTNIAYLQPFEDGNKRTSRMLANIPLLMQNNSPLSFIGTKVEDYASAMLGVYEKNDLTLARELFEYTYAKSCEHHQALAILTPRYIPVAQRYSEQIRTTVRDILVHNADISYSIDSQLDALSKKDQPNEVEKEDLMMTIQQVLNNLNPLDATYYGVSRERVQDWLERNSNDLTPKVKIK